MSQRPLQLSTSSSVESQEIADLVRVIATFNKRDGSLAAACDSLSQLRTVPIRQPRGVHQRHADRERLALVRRQPRHTA